MIARRIRRKGQVRDGNGPLIAKPTVFLPDMEQQVKMIAMKGASDDEIADMFGVDKALFQRWRKAYPSFNAAVKAGRSKPDAEVTYSLFKRAIGYEYEEDGLTRTGAIKSLKRHLPGDVTAIKHWLTNRKREDWTDRTTHEVQGGPKGSPPVSIASRDELIAGILALVSPKPDGDSRPKK